MSSGWVYSFWSWHQVYVFPKVFISLLFFIWLLPPLEQEEVVLFSFHKAINRESSGSAYILNG